MSTSTTEPTWTEEAVRDLRRMFDRGDTFGQIGAALGITRNAALSKASRMKLKRDLEGLPNRPPRRARSRKLHASEQARVTRMAKVARVAEDDDGPDTLPPERVDDQAIPIEQRRTLMELENHHCRFPVGTPGMDGFFFCAHPSADLIADRPYCGAHARVSYRPTGRV